jgi:hypothetical protein
MKAMLEEHEIQVPKVHSVVRLFGIITEDIELGSKIDGNANEKSNYKPLEG